MRCLECQNILHQFIDGKVDSQTRKEVGLHLAECEDCSRLIEGDKFWDDALLSHLDKNAPADLRASILADTIGQRKSSESETGSTLSWRTQLKIILWSGTRKNSPKFWFELVATIGTTLLFIYLLPKVISLIS